MQEILEFAGKAILGKVAGDGVYDGLKSIFGSYFDKLSSYLKEGKKEKFEASLEMLLENEETKRKILDLLAGKETTKRIEIANKLFYNKPLTPQRKIWLADKY